MIQRFTILILLFMPAMNILGQQPDISFRSSDTALETAFTRAKEMALSYKGNENDPVGPWYEAALPSRNAFCIRDVSHQAIAGEILGLGKANRNMITLFVSNISESKDWCTYWEMNKFGKPAPEDYRNDDEFWYNLNANFELVNTSWRMFQWTGDSTYINHPVFRRFFELTLTNYIDRWYLNPGQLMNRPEYPNAPQPFNFQDNFHRCRGIPSYYEGVNNMSMSADLVAAIFRAMKSYAAISRFQGNTELARRYDKKAEIYREHLDKVWWNPSEKMYYNFITHDKNFGKGEGGTSLLWYDALADSNRVKFTIERILDSKMNVENMSYLPALLSKYGYYDAAYKFILYLTDPSTKRREYPEVSFGVIEGIVQGMMGVEPDARYNRITTIYNSESPQHVELNNLGLLQTTVNISHGNHRSRLHNLGDRQLNWRAGFHGRCKFVMVNGRKHKPSYQPGIKGGWRSFIDIPVKPGNKIEVVAVYH